jgi:hypothetical protein
MKFYLWYSRFVDAQQEGKVGFVGSYDLAGESLSSKTS